MGQGIRPSQFITTYGPGAIIEGADGPRVVASLDRSDIFAGAQAVQRFEITEGRLSQGLLGGARITRLPSNAELSVPGGTEVYKTFPFPQWSLCAIHGVVYDQRSRCPNCGQVDGDRIRRESIRFVQACPAGHMDDVRWYSLINHNCRPTHLLWVGGGAALRNITIRCPDCGAVRNFGEAYRDSYACSGRLPESGWGRNFNCNQRAKIIHRGAANLRLPIIQTVLTIPPRISRLHRMLESDAVYSVVLATNAREKAPLLGFLRPLVDGGRIPRPVFEAISAAADDVVRQALTDVLQIPQNVSPDQIRADELVALQHAAVHGAPPVQAAAPGSAEAFSVFRDDIRTVSYGRLTFRITPVNRLRVVMVQTGYRRLNDTGAPVSVEYAPQQSRWLPGVELLGEGLFVDLVDQDGSVIPPPLRSPAAAQWQAAITVDRPLRRPGYVWWHTLSHRLLTAISIDSGYSAAAIRERVYASTDPANPIGGVLLYTAQPGGDGTFGGMLALAERFEDIMREAFEFLARCSNDPLCAEQEFSSDKANGAACYACEFVSETSCESRNMFLDRHVLLPDLE
jgi:hypothetical protein